MFDKGFSSGAAKRLRRSLSYRRRRVLHRRRGKRCPRKVGQCVRTEISELGSRLEGAPDSGSAVAYANGVTGVSYDVVTPLRRSRVGDPVTLCLVSIPRNCPPGDDRGKVYSAANWRTQERWSLPDSQHSCGGA